ncbi:hypothetical protein [Bradyrhizobium niftali]|uniref:Uncharacterized protein n=1 Tax=Bradyrhizobium niftali TaxID=2560055 RepID=A0A4Y9L5J8_9BRAD|nr:hypothetical protein [Bradyrhizobium niftali]TFV37957.1 hypothetical protein E4K65_42485 [Bradyrhizobium niftali]
MESPRLYQWSAQALHLTTKGIAKLQEIGFEVAPRELDQIRQQLKAEEAAFSTAKKPRQKKQVDLALVHQVKAQDRILDYRERKGPRECGPEVFRLHAL